MIDLTIINTGRNDDFGERFLERFSFALKANLKFFDRSNITYEYILVDWFPYDNKHYLINTDLLKDKLKHKSIKNIIVDNNIAIPEKLGQKVFYEYFAKNVGIRQAIGKYILLINSDIIIPEKLVILLKEIIVKNEDNKFYRTLWRYNVDFLQDNEIEIINTLNLYHPQNKDGFLLGAYSGDFLFLKRDIINTITGFDETCKEHRNNNKWQCGMDGEILWNLHNNKNKIEIIDCEYYHLIHNYKLVNNNLKVVDGIYRQNIKYKNLDNWGFINYNKHNINDNTILIHNYGDINEL